MAVIGGFVGCFLDGGAAGVAEAEEFGGFVESFAGCVVEGLAEDVGDAVVADFDDGGMATGNHKREALVVEFGVRSSEFGIFRLRCRVECGVRSVE